MDSNRIVVVGRIGSSYGVKGWTHVRSYTEPIENLTDFPQLYGRRNEEPWRKLGSIEFRRHRDGLIAKLDGCDDRTEASTLSNLELGVQRDILPPLEEGEFYWVDLIGLDVVNIEDTTLGKISNVIETDASPILDVKAADTHYLIPFVKPVLDSVELTSHVRVKWDKDWLA